MFLSLLQLLLAYVKTPRYEGPEVDRAAAEHDAKALYKAGERRLGTDEKTFIRMFSERSWAHLAFVSAAYHNMYGNSLEKVFFFSFFKKKKTLCLTLVSEFDER